MDGGTNNRKLRPGSLRTLKDNARTKIGESSFCTSAAKLWNAEPEKIKEAKTIMAAKKLIKEYCKTMPV